METEGFAIYDALRQLKNEVSAFSEMYVSCGYVHCSGSRDGSRMIGIGFDGM